MAYRLLKDAKEWNIEVSGDEVSIRFGKTGRANQSMRIPSTKCRGNDPEQELAHRLRKKLSEGYDYAPGSERLAGSPPVPDAEEDLGLHLVLTQAATRNDCLRKLPQVAEVLGLTSNDNDQTFIDPNDSEQVLTLKSPLRAGYAKSKTAPVAALMAAIAFALNLTVTQGSRSESVVLRDIFNELDPITFAALADMGFAPAPLQICITRPSSVGRAVEIW